MLETIKAVRNLELYKLCCTEDNEYGARFADELGWINDEEFCIWVPYLYLHEFMKSLTEMFGYGIFDDGGFDVNMNSNGVCIDLCAAIGECIDIEEVFPKEVTSGGSTGENGGKA